MTKIEGVRFSCDRIIQGPRREGLLWRWSLCSVWNLLIGFWRSRFNGVLLVKMLESCVAGEQKKVPEDEG